MRLRDKFRAWLVAFLRDDDLHGKVNQIGITMQGVLHQVEEMHTLLPMLHRTLNEFARAEDTHAAMAQDRELLRRIDVDAVQKSLGALQELEERIHLLIAPIVGAPKPKRIPRDWDAVQHENLGQFEENKDGKPVR